ncbi:MAG: preprotein translocase subunit SecE [Bifidobacteriaceae bacterium]|jgi:preprotein translocase subunit SecE|nr:preprotein translocase subunit SecE [Bifidobacteriaceae bacterium]
MAKAAEVAKPRLNPVARLVRFVRQVIAELKKVVRPTRQELMTYSSVVVVFVLIVMGFIFGIDYVIGKLVMWVFG